MLLKNLNGALPLTNETNIAIFGNDAPYPTIGSAYRDSGEDTAGFEMGTFIIGGGSGAVRDTHLVTPEGAIKKHVEQLGGRVQMLFDNSEIADGRFRTIYPTPHACLLFLKAFAAETLDRPSLDLQYNATKAVESTARRCPNTIVVTHGPGVNLMPWADNENVTAIIAAHYPGDESGNAIVDVLWGAVEPSERLPYSIPKNLADSGPPLVESVADPTDPDAWHADFSEGQMIDYRQFDSNGTEALFEFGFGLGYTTFSLANDLSVSVPEQVSALADKANGIAPGGLVDLWKVIATASVEVTNTGERAGFAVPQLYASLPQDTTPPGTPSNVLRGFEKVYLQPGEAQKVSFELMRRDLSYWNVDSKQWVIPKGSIGLMAGFSSADLPTRAEVEVLG